MDNQHRKITGYRELDEVEIALINSIKEQGEQLYKLISEISHTSADQRWLQIGATHLQQGLMALTRAVAKPTSF